MKCQGSDELIAVKPANCEAAPAPESRPNQSYTVPEAKEKLSILKKGEKAIYTMTGELVTVEKVHSEDDPSDPYYTITLGSDGREKQTTRYKLCLDACLDVSGTCFTEPVSTLCIEGQVLAKFSPGSSSQESSLLTLDRDATLFTTVVAYLRFLKQAADPQPRNPKQGATSRVA